jgi:hypothetical protein
MNDTVENSEATTSTERERERARERKELLESSGPLTFNVKYCGSLRH